MRLLDFSFRLLMRYDFQKGVRLLEIAAETARLLAAVDASAQPRLLELAKEYRQLIQARFAYFRVFAFGFMLGECVLQEIYSELHPLAGGQSAEVSDDMMQ